MFYVPRLSIGCRTFSGIALGALLKLVNTNPSRLNDLLKCSPCMAFADTPRKELPPLLEFDLQTGIVLFIVLLFGCTPVHGLSATVAPFCASPNADSPFGVSSKGARPGTVCP